MRTFSRAVLAVALICAAPSLLGAQAPGSGRVEHQRHRGSIALVRKADALLEELRALAAEGQPVLFEHPNSMHLFSGIEADLRPFHAWEYYDDAGWISAVADAIARYQETAGRPDRRARWVHQASASGPTSPPRSRSGGSVSTTTASR